MRLSTIYIGVWPFRQSSQLDGTGWVTVSTVVLYRCRLYRTPYKLRCIDVQPYAATSAVILVSPHIVAKPPFKTQRPLRQLPDNRWCNHIVFIFKNAISTNKPGMATSVIAPASGASSNGTSIARMSLAAIDPFDGTACAGSRDPIIKLLI